MPLVAAPAGVRRASCSEHCSRKRMQQNKKRKKSRFWILKKKIKKRKSNDKLSFRDNSISFCPVSVSIKLLRSYFNQQFYIMLYVYVTVFFFQSTHSET